MIPDCLPLADDRDLSTQSFLFITRKIYWIFRILIACMLLTPLGAGFLHPYITPELANHFLQCSSCNAGLRMTIPNPPYRWNHVFRY